MRVSMKRQNEKRDTVGLFREKINMSSILWGSSCAHLIEEAAEVLRESRNESKNASVNQISTVYSTSVSYAAP